MQCWVWWEGGRGRGGFPPTHWGAAACAAGPPHLPPSSTLASAALGGEVCPLRCTYSFLCSMPCSLSISLFERQSLSSMLHVLLFSLKVLCRVLCFTSFVHLHSFYNLTLLVNLSIENKKLVTILSLFSTSPYLTS